MPPLKIARKQLLPAARRSILLVVSAVLAVSAGASEPAGIRYSDFIKYGAPVHAPLAGEESVYAGSFSPALSAAPAGALYGVIFGVIGLVAAVAVVADKKGVSATPTATPSCTDPKPTFSRATSRQYSDDAGNLMGAMPGDFSEAIPINGVQGELLSNLVELRNAAKNGFLGRSFEPGRFVIQGESADQAPMAGDAVRAGQDTGDGNNTTNSREYRIYSEGGSELYFAEGASYTGDYVSGNASGGGMVDGGVRECVPGTGRFFLDANYAATQNLADALEIFRLRADWRGLIGGEAVRIGNFMVSQNADLRNMHVEHQATPLAAGNFTLHTNSGYRRFDDGRSTMTYAQTTATWEFARSLQLYAQNTGGLLNSTKYTDGRLQSHAFGVFADKVLRHDDSYHLRIESPFADTRAQTWRLAVDTSIGTASDYLRLGLHSSFGSGEVGGHVFYTREF